MPAGDALPEDIRALSAFQALPLPEQYFDQGIDRILQRLSGPRRRAWKLGIAAALAVTAAIVAWILIAKYWAGKSTYVVQVFEEQNGPAVPNVKVRVKSLVTEELDTQTSDAEGLTRFRLRNGSILALGLEYPRNGRCIGAKLPAFAAPKLPAVTPVYLDAIPVRLQGACGEAGSSNIETVAVRAGVPNPAISIGKTTGDQSFLRYHLPWGVPAAPVVISRRGYAVGFDPAIKLARWVGYRVNYAGPRRRRPARYSPDLLIPEGAQLASSAYADNPYDRGNLVRRLDVGEEDEDSAFYLSVIAPQADRMNQRVWVRIEDLATLASTRSDVWVLGGTAFLPASGATEVVTPRLGGNVPVPTHWFRVTLRKRQNGSIETLSFLVPNDFTASSQPEPYLTSIEEIERVTGLRLLDELPEADRLRLKSERASSLWTID
jgi:endonuclease G